MLLKKSYIYASMLGFNILVVGITLILWYYFMGIDLNLEWSSSPPTKVHVINENDLIKLPWIKDIPANIEKSEKYCKSEHGCYCLGQDCPNFPSIHIYQLKTVVETLELTTTVYPLGTDIDNYFGWFEYEGKYYTVSIHLREYDQNYIFNGLIIAVVGTLAIALVWAKFRPK